jgi:hypothetical protein
MARCSNFDDSTRALVMHEFLDLALRCKANPNDAALASRFASEAAHVGPLLVQRLRTLEQENQQLRASSEAGPMLLRTTD